MTVCVPAVAYGCLWLQDAQRVRRSWLRYAKRSNGRGWIDTGETKIFSASKCQRSRLATQRQRLAGVGEGERDRVQAVALMGRRRAIVEHVAQVGVAALAADLDADHAVAVIG